MCIFCDPLISMPLHWKAGKCLKDLVIISVKLAMSKTTLLSYVEFRETTPLHFPNTNLKLTPAYTFFRNVVSFFLHFFLFLKTTIIFVKQGIQTKAALFSLSLLLTTVLGSLFLALKHSTWLLWFTHSLWTEFFFIICVSPIALFVPGNSFMLCMYLDCPIRMWHYYVHIEY